MKRLVAAIFFAALFCATIASATDEETLRFGRLMYQKNASFRAARQELLSLTQAFESVRASGRYEERVGPIRTPVVVHVVYKSQDQNVSDEQIRSQIAVLNADYQKLNADASSVPDPFRSRVGNALLQFELAVRDPAGKATTGITRTQTTESEFHYRRSQGGRGQVQQPGRTRRVAARPLLEPLGLQAGREPARLRLVPGRVHCWHSGVDSTEHFQRHEAAQLLFSCASVVKGYCSLLSWHVEEWL